MLLQKEKVLSSGTTLVADLPLVLIVDDEPGIRATLADVLEDDNFRTIVAHDGPSALELIVNRQPDLVFLDIWLTGWDGIETLERIKEVSPKLPVIMISGHATISNALEATRLGAFDFIEKPLSIESVVLSAKRALEKSKQDKGQKTTLEEAKEGEQELPLLQHPGILSQGLAGRNLGQRTLKKSIIFYGQGLHSGRKSGLVLEPLPLNSGIHFVNIGRSQVVPAFVDYVESTDFATTLRFGGAVAATIEHLMSALRAYGISNLLVKCNGEIPIFDGSAVEFCERIEEAGISEQGGKWFEIAVDHEVTVFASKQGSEALTISPSPRNIIAYELHYPDPVGKQSFEFAFDSVQAFKQEIAPARTFGFMRDVEKLQRAGLAAGGRLDNFILIDSEKVVNTSLRFPNELARHKILDIMGDLFLFGRPIRGKVTAKMTGHSDNISLLKKLQPLVMANTTQVN